MKLAISVVIACFNEEKYVGKLLSDIAGQTYKPREVIVADSTSTDGTIAAAERYQERLPLKIATTKIRTPGAARNSGAKKASGNYIIFLDADMRLPRTAFDQVAASIQQTGADYLTPLYSTPGRHPFDQIVIKIINFDIRHGLTGKDHLPGMGGFMCIKKALHNKIEGFDANMVKENDIEYLERLKKINASYKVLTDLVVETSNRRHLKDGRFISFLNYFPKRSRFTKLIVSPLLKKLNKEKKYGIF